MKPPSHTITDHALGASAFHAHGPGDDADHTHDADDNLVAEGSSELEDVPLISIGVDIGSSGTQIIFSRLLMRGPGEPLAMRRQVKARETLYLSPIALTPFVGDRIDTQRLRSIVDRAHLAAGIMPDAVETGVVIMTGAAAARENAAAILDVLSQECGELVSAAAGDHMEAALAAHGSGAVERSRRELSRILNIDVGGASTKFALVESGRIVASAAMAVGGRQMAVDLENRIVRLDASGVLNARRAGVDWRLGAVAQKADMHRVAQAMADDVIAATAGRPLQDGVWVTDPLPPLGDVNGVQFSGGVAEYVYDRETRDFGDLGWRLGRALGQRFEADAGCAILLPAGECIRATALGASQYSVQMSGQTSCVTSHAALLPRRNLPVLQPAFDFSGEIEPDGLAHAIRAHRALFDDHDPAREAAFAFRWRGEPSYPRLRALAQGITAGLLDRVLAGANLYIMLEGDAAATLGAVLREDLGVANEILVLDGIVLRDFDFVDLGRIRLPSCMIPVTVKSLVFGAPAPQGG